MGVWGLHRHFTSLELSKIIIFFNCKIGSDYTLQLKHSFYRKHANEIQDDLIVLTARGRADVVKLGFGITGQVKCTVQIAIYSPLESSGHSAVKQLLRKEDC
jgi:hypothetical protein